MCSSDLIAQMPGLRTALEPIATELGLTADNATLAKIATGELSPAMDEATGAAGAFAEGMGDAAEATQSAADAATEALSAMRDLANEFIGAERGVLDYADAMDEAAEAAQENGKHWEDGTEAADENKRALLDLAEQAWATADALSAEGKSGTFLEQAREDLIETAVEMGMGREAAEEYVNQLLATPGDIATQVDLDTQAAREEWAALWDELGYHPPEVPVGADTQPAEDSLMVFEDSIVSSDPTLAPVGADTSGAQEEVTIWGAQVGDVPTAPVIIDADTYYGTVALGKFVDAVDGAGGTVEINGETMTADEALDALVDKINRGEGVVNINGIPTDAETALLQLVSHINGSEGVVTIEANNDPAFHKTDEAKSKADNTTGTIDVDANTGEAESKSDTAARDRSSTINVDANTMGANLAINSAARTRTAFINVVTSGLSSLRAGMANVNRAAGGPVYGPGTGTSDSIPAMLSTGEHVITAKEVAMAGGQDAIYRMREAIRSGFRFADGGAVERGSHVPVMSTVPVQRSQSVSASVDSAALASAVRSGMQGMGVQLNLDGRTLYGAVVQAGKDARRPFVTKGM